MPTKTPKSPTTKAPKTPAPRTGKSTATLDDLDNVRNMLVGNDIKLATALNDNTITNNQLEGEFRASIQNHGAGIKRAHDGLRDHSESIKSLWREQHDAEDRHDRLDQTVGEAIDRGNDKTRRQCLFNFVTVVWLVFLTFCFYAVVRNADRQAKARDNDGVRHVQPPAPANAGNVAPQR